MSKPKKHFVVTTAEGVQPLKRWFYANIENQPSQKWTSHVMRRHLKNKQGWSIKELSDRVLVVQPGAKLPEISTENMPPTPAESLYESDESSLFALESHLRDYLAKNLSILKLGPSLSVVEVEHSTDVGLIDLLAKGDNGDYYVFELKLERGPDAALGQLLRYMGWCSKHLAQGRKVFGVVLAAEISEKLRYAASMVENVVLLEYELQMKINSVEGI